MNKREYEEYEESVKDFFKKEGINCLSQMDMEVEPYFSSSYCEVCNRYFGGDRYDCSGYNPIIKQVQEDYEVCSDCLYYAEYGRLDDMTMGDIEQSEKDLDHYKAHQYAWPGGYQINALMADGEILCHHCICTEEEVYQDDSKVDSDPWRFLLGDIHWEGEPLCCAHCGRDLPSEYGIPDEEGDNLT